MGLGPGGSHLLNAYYVPGTEEEQLIRSHQPWDRGLKVLGRKQLLVTWGFLGAPCLRLAGRRRGIFETLVYHRSMWDPGQPEG